MGNLRWGRFTVISAGIMFLATTFTTDCFSSQAGVMLGETFVPKEKMLVYICIGNSAMSGRDPAFSRNTVPNAWSYRIPNPVADRKDGNRDIQTTLHKWALAKTPLHIDRKDNFNKQDPTTPFIQSLAERSEHEGYYFGVLQLSGSEYLVSTFQRGKYRYDSIVNAAITLKPNVTIAAIVSMFNLVEMEYGANEVAAYLTNTEKMVSQMRQDLGMPDLPYVHSGYPVMAGSEYEISRSLPKQIIGLIEQIPENISNSAIIPTDGLTIWQGDQYKSHYDSSGCHNWGKRTADTVIAREWVPMITSNSRRTEVAKKVPMSAARMTDAVYITNGKIPAALSTGTAIYTLQGKCVGSPLHDQSRDRTCMNPGLYIIRRNR